MAKKINVITEACAALKTGARDQAINLLRSEYTFAPLPIGKREYGPFESTKVLVRDGFIDRYTAEPLL